MASFADARIASCATSSFCVGNGPGNQRLASKQQTCTHGATVHGNTSTGQREIHGNLNLLVLLSLFRAWQAVQAPSLLTPRRVKIATSSTFCMFIMSYSMRSASAAEGAFLPPTPTLPKIADNFRDILAWAAEVSAP